MNLFRNTSSLFLCIALCPPLFGADLSLQDQIKFDIHRIQGLLADAKTELDKSNIPEARSRLLNVNDLLQMARSELPVLRMKKRIESSRKDILAGRRNEAASDLNPITEDLQATRSLSSKEVQTIKSHLKMALGDLGWVETQSKALTELDIMSSFLNIGDTSAALHEGFDPLLNSVFVELNQGNKAEAGLKIKDLQNSLKSEFQNFI